MKIDDKYKWLARDEDGRLCGFDNKPFKIENEWDIDSGLADYIKETDSTYSFIKWNDNEPTSVGDLRLKLANVKTMAEYAEPNPINKPSHYIGINGLEVETVLQNFIPKYKDGYVAHRASSAIEYLLRSPEKNQLEDIKKAKQNLEQIIEYEEAKEQTIEKELKVSNFKMSCAVNSPFVSDNLMEFLNSLSNIPNEIKNYHAGTNPLD